MTGGNQAFDEQGKIGNQQLADRFDQTIAGFISFPPLRSISDDRLATAPSVGLINFRLNHLERLVRKCRFNDSFAHDCRTRHHA